MPLAQRDPQLPPREVRTEATVHTTAERDVRVVLAVEANVHRVVVRRRDPCSRRRSSASPRCPARRGRHSAGRPGTCAIRGTPVGTGDSHRSSSSTASGMIDGSSTIICRCSGCVARNAYEQVSVSLTVSSPAMRNRKQMSRISSFVSRSPSISALTKRVMMSSAGLRGAFVDEVAEVLVDLRTGRRRHRRARVAVGECVLVPLLRMQDPVTHAEEHAHLVLGQTHQAEEHRRREQLGELLAEIALAAIDERIDEAVHPTSDVFLLLVHASWREQGVEQLPVLRVHRGVDVQRDHRPDVAQVHVDDRRELLRRGATRTRCSHARSSAPSPASARQNRPGRSGRGSAPAARRGRASPPSPSAGTRWRLLLRRSRPSSFPSWQSPDWFRTVGEGPPCTTARWARRVHFLAAQLGSPPAVRLTWLLPSAFIVQMLPARSNAMRVPPGDHAGAVPSAVSAVGFGAPPALATHKPVGSDGSVHVRLTGKRDPGAVG